MPSLIVIFGLNPQGLFLLREFARLGIRVLGIARKGEVGIKSRYGEVRVLEEDGDLTPLTNEIFDGGISDYRVFVTSDYFLNLIVGHHPELFDRVPFVLSPLETIRILANKQSTYEQAQRLKIKVPTTVGLKQYERLQSNSFPLILKWNETPTGMQLPFKTRFIADSESARKNAFAYSSIAEFLILQEVISGIDLSYAAFFDHGKEVFGCVTQKPRQAPMGLSSYVTDYNGAKAEECLEAGRRFMQDQNAHGFVEVEFRLRSDGQLYLIEVNPRIWGWAKFLKLKYPNFQDVLFNTEINVSVNMAPCKWFNLLRDLKALGVSLKREKNLALIVDFVLSYRGTKILDVLEFRDLGPFFYQLYKGLTRSSQ